MKAVLVCAILVSCYGYSLNYSLGNRQERSADQLDDLKTKLARLSSLLKEIQAEEKENGPESSDDVEKLLLAVDHPKEKLTTQAAIQDTGNAENMKSKKFAESMTLRDVQTLRELKRILEQAKTKKQAPVLPAKDAGTFTDETVDEKQDETNQFDWRTLARELQSQRDAFYLQKKMTEELPEDGPENVKTKEGVFGAFRDEIKESVEKNLLSDIALAIHSGISFEEIISDLTKPEPPQGESGWWKRY